MKYLMIFIGVLVAAGLGLYGMMGGFHSVQIKQVEFPATEIIFVTHKGPYEKLKEAWMGFAEKIQEAQLKNCDGYGVYLDPPDTKPEELRSILACKIDQYDEAEKTRLRGIFSSFTLPTATSFQTQFPYVNEFSFMFAPMMVYPKFQNLIATNQVQPSVMIEGYGTDSERKNIQFFMPANTPVEAFKGLMEAF